MADTIVHGTTTKGQHHNQGEKHGLAKLTAAKVVEIRRLYATRKYTQRELAEMFGVCQGKIGSVVQGTSWAHITEGVANSEEDKADRKARAGCKGSASPQSKLTDGRVREMRRLYATGSFSQDRLGRMFGIDQTTVSGIVRGKCWKHVPMANAK
jgi:predicted XRE-type DNA-binding protein